MNTEDKKKFVSDVVEQKVAELKAKWAMNYCVMKIQENIVSSEKDEKKVTVAKNEIESCKKYMDVAEQEIANFEWVGKQKI